MKDYSVVNSKYDTITKVLFKIYDEGYEQGLKDAADKTEQIPDPDETNHFQAILNSVDILRSLNDIEKDLLQYHWDLGVSGKTTECAVVSQCLHIVHNCINEKIEDKKHRLINDI